MISEGESLEILQVESEISLKEKEEMYYECLKMEMLIAVCVVVGGGGKDKDLKTKNMIRAQAFSCLQCFNNSDISL